MSEPCPGSCCIDGPHEHRGPWVALFATPERGPVVYNFEAIGTDPPGAFTARGNASAGPDDVLAMLAGIAGGADDMVTVCGTASGAEVLEAVKGLAGSGGTLYVAPGTVIA